MTPEFQHAIPKVSGIRHQFKHQSGQALIYGLFVLIGGLAGLFFLFNTGQLTREKIKLVNTADAVAYSAGVMHARTLNYEAYTNRAMMANTVAIAQMVSLSSWAQYVDTMGEYGFDLTNPKFALFYPSYAAARAYGVELDELLNDSTGGQSSSTGFLQGLESYSDKIIRNALMPAQQLAYAGLIPSRLIVMNDVAKANYRNDGEVTVDPVPLTGTEFTSFVSRYSDDDRKRFADAVTIAANKDPFVPKRSFEMPGLYADCVGAFPRVDFLTRRGGTDMVSYDEWKAVDTLSEKDWVPKNKTDVTCQAISSTPLGWGGDDAADNSGLDINPLHYDSALLANPDTFGMAAVSSNTWGYSGLPNFYDLSEDTLKQADPRLRFAIRVRRKSAQTATSDGRSQIATTPRLNNYHNDFAGGDEMVAVSASEVFFDRSGAGPNQYGATSGKPQEIGSLFNPFWQVHLIQSDSDVRKAQLLQGVVLP